MSLDRRGFVLGPDGGDATWFMDTRMTVKAGGTQTRGAFTFLEWRAPLGFGPPAHVHEQEDEAFYLLAGEMEVRCGDDSWAAGPGSFVFLPGRVAHCFVVTAGPAHGLQVTSPSGFEDYIDLLGRPPGHDGLPEPTEPDIPAVLAAGERFHLRVVGPPMTLPSTTPPPASAPQAHR